MECLSTSTHSVRPRTEGHTRAPIYPLQQKSDPNRCVHQPFKLERTGVSGYSSPPSVLSISTAEQVVEYDIMGGAGGLF
ncbi:hypothetical protein JTE90_011792 [Oedothorax gibbosus]|uniref:Uncharacterized protein n=1 Tax=Oedothorax gibbosus TaxID=931172 RepID=A0AAV6VTE8_9ARAC|nr:hypothetical protein JTE90_011792 [Oedothorax gibbosus]